MQLQLQLIVGTIIKSKTSFIIYECFVPFFTSKIYLAASFSFCSAIKYFSFRCCIVSGKQRLGSSLNFINSVSDIKRYSEAELMSKISFSIFLKEYGKI